MCNATVKCQPENYTAIENLYLTLFPDPGDVHP